MKLQLVEGWRKAWQWPSLWLHQIGTALAAVMLLVPTVPAEIQAFLPPKWRAALIAAWWLAGLVARMTKKHG